MKLNIRHAFACSPAELLALLDDDAFNQRLLDAAGLDSTVLQNDVIDGVLHRRVRCLGREPLPGFMGKALGVERMDYEQRSWTQVSDGAQRWEVHPAFGGGKVQTSGTTRVVATGAGCERVIEGDCTVKVRLIGRKIEGVIVAGTEKSYEAAAATIRAELAARAAG